jgi:hypothetical protein
VSAAANVWFDAPRRSLRRRSCGITAAITQTDRRGGRQARRPVETGGDAKGKERNRLGKRFFDTKGWTVLRGLTLFLIGVLGLVSFVYGFGVLMSHGWAAVEGRRVSSQTWQLLPALAADSGVAVLDRGVSGTFAVYRYEVDGQTYLAPRWVLAPQSERDVDVHHLASAPALAVPAPHFPWATLFALPLVCVLLALWLSRSGTITSALRASAHVAEFA